MIRFEPSSKPEQFEARAEQRGNRWLAAHPTGRPPPYWNDFRTALSDAFRSLCAYGVMHEPVGTVDHFVSIEEDRSRSYDWSNYRFASQWLKRGRLKIPAETELPDGLTIVRDELNERWNATHYTIAPADDMPLVQFRALLARLGEALAAAERAL